jgi:hypothetical protein
MSHFFLKPEETRAGTRIRTSYFSLVSVTSWTNCRMYEQNSNIDNLFIALGVMFVYTNGGELIRYVRPTERSRHKC